MIVLEVSLIRAFLFGDLPGKLPDAVDVVPVVAGTFGEEFGLDMGSDTVDEVWHAILP